MEKIPQPLTASEAGLGPAIRIVVVDSQSKPLAHQAVVKLVSNEHQTTNWQTTSSKSETAFVGLGFGNYQVEVSAVGYVSSHKEIAITNLVDTVQAEIVLEHDPSAGSGSDGVAMPPKAAEEMRRAIKALSSGNLKEAQKRLEEADSLSPANARLKFLFGYLSYQKKEYEEAQNYLTQATQLRPRYVQALTLLGRVQLLRGQSQEAVATLEAALAADPDSWTLHTLLGNAYEAQKQYDKAREQAQAAGILREKGAFVPANDVVPPVNPSALEMSWQPPEIDRVKPLLAAGVHCPVEQVIQGAGERVEEMVTNVGRFAAIEEMLHERLDEIGNPSFRESRKFDYAAGIYQSRPGMVQVDEYRTERYGISTLPDRIADNGFAALALVFHPAMRDSFHMTCEGLGDWQGQATWVVRFQQREDRPNNIQSYLVGGVVYPVSLRGRAWITADKFQIVRIETEMTSPMPQIELLAEHCITEYGPVPFSKINLELWLPKSAEMYMYFRGQRYHRKHSFEKYMLFSVDAEQKGVREAKHDPSGPKSDNSTKHSGSRS